MRLISFFVKNYQFTLIMFLMVVVVSVTTLLTMPRAEDPEISPPEFPVVVIYPGTSPKDMEELVVKPIEKKVSELENLKRVTSTIDDGIAVIDVEYKYGSNVESKYQEIVREINAIRPQLPQDLYSLEIRKVSPTDVSVIQTALVSENASDEQLKHYAEDLKERLEKVSSLKKVNFWGLPDQIIRVDLRLEKLAQLHIPVNYVIGSIQSEGANIPGGSVRAGTKTFNVKTSGKYKSLEEIQNTIVYSANGNVVYLKDVAEVGFNYQDPTHITRINGHRCVLVTARAEKRGEHRAYQGHV